MSQINDTMVTLEWSEPLDRGGRLDLTYRVLCSVCLTPVQVQDPLKTRGWGPLGGAGPGSCPPCDDSVLYWPGQGGLTQSRVVVWGLRPHTEYTFTVQSLNGVSALIQLEPASDSVNVTTSRDGTSQVLHWHGLVCRGLSRVYHFVWQDVHTRLYTYTHISVYVHTHVCICINTRLYTYTNTSVYI